MKKNFLIIILSIIGLSINYEYDLSSGVSRSFNLSSSYTYKFYIKAEIGQTVVFTISKSDDYLPSSQKIYFYEYSSRNPKSYDYHSYSYPSYHSNSFSKTIYPLSYSTTYIAMEITPDSTISNVEIKATVSGTSSKQDIDKAVGLVGLSLLAVILIPILVCICITVAIICVCCRKRDNNVVYINNPATNPNPPVQPLYPTNPPPQYIQNNPPPQYMANNPPPQYIPPPQ